MPTGYALPVTTAGIPSDPGPRSHPVRMFLRGANVILLAVSGGLLLAGGLYLLWLGGSAWYGLAGLASLVCCGLVWVRRAGSALALYMLLLAATLIWSLGEIGWDGWALTARLAAPAVVGFLLLLLVLPVRAGVAAFVASLIGVAAICSSLATGPASDRLAGWSPSTASGWDRIGGDIAGTRHSAATQITPANISHLALAWDYRTGEDNAGMPHASFEATPVLHGDTLYFCTPRNIVIALDADSGKQRWRTDPHLDLTGINGGSCRGVALHDDMPASGAKAGGGATECAVRILEATITAKLLAFDAVDGKPCSEFGQNGVVDLKAGLGPVTPGHYAETSPPTIVGDLAILGGVVADNIEVGGASGVIRAYDVHSGALRWAWDMGHPDRPGAPPPGDVFTRGTPNSWSYFSADPALGLVYVPTGNSTPDYFGAHRSAVSERYASAIVALDIATGRPRWAYQTVHHDLWDYDVAAQPTLVDWPVGGRTVPALVQATKTGQIFVLDRRTGRPLLPVVERPVPQTDIAGEWTAPTQPRSIGMPQLSRETMSEADMWGITPLDQLWCRIRFRRLRYDGMFTPPALSGGLATPGWVGGVNWGGVSIDPVLGLLIANANQMAVQSTLLPRADTTHAGNTEDDPMAVAPMTGTPYKVRSQPFLSPLGVPCQRPPFGTLSAIDMHTGRLAWSHPVGSTIDTGPLGLRLGIPLPMGMPNMGGSITTASGLVFVGATLDAYLRAFDIRDGRELLRLRLPAGGQATPMTYVSPRTGMQFVVIAAGGNMVLGSRTGDHMMAFRLKP